MVLLVIFEALYKIFEEELGNLIATGASEKSFFDNTYLLTLSWIDLRWLYWKTSTLVVALAGNSNMIGFMEEEFEGQVAW